MVMNSNQNITFNIYYVNFVAFKFNIMLTIIVL